jgi:hypothetical protein
MRADSQKVPFQTVTVLLALCAGVRAQDPRIAAGPLAGLPSAPGAHVARIRDLPDDTWLELGTPAPDPTWGTPGGRSWTSEMPLSPRLRGAFLYGEGVHGYTKPNGRYMDDLWFYDINRHRWICVYPGADIKTLKLQLNADGFETTADGQLVPVAQQVHGYEMNAYDTDQDRYVMMPNLHSYWEKALPQRKAWLKSPPADASPWFYEAGSGKWTRVRTGTPGPQSSYGDTLIYLPDRHQAFFLHRSDDAWLYDTKANQWKKLNPKGPVPAFGIDATSCYDGKRHRIYIGGGSYPVAESGNAFWIYDVAQNTWIDPKPAGAPCKGSKSYPTKNAVMVYDTVNDKVLLVFHSYHDDRPDRLGVYVYDPAGNSWGERALAVPDKLGRDRQVKNGFYDPELNAVFVHTAGDSRDRGAIWVYRFKGGR